MTQPTPYTRQYNFTDYQTTNPNSPLPGASVDAELNAVKVTSDQTRTNLGVIQRDDTKLANQSVHKDAFDRDALAMIGVDGFNPRGNWAAATVYAPQDLVNYNNATYLALIAHTATSVFPTDLAAGKWLLIANAAIGDVSSAVDYFTGNGSTTAFTLTYSYTSNTGVQVYVNGVLQLPTVGATPGDYSVSGSTLTFVTAPAAPSVAGRKNVVVWGANVTVQANVTAAQTAASNAQGYATAAAGSATSAATSAATATTQAANAVTSATSAAASASTATTQATTATTQATNAATSATGANTAKVTAEQWADQTTGIVASTDYSSKAWAIGGTGVTSTAARGAAKEWAVKIGSTVDGTDYSAKYHATAAATSATGAATSATNAQTSATTATTQASNASASASAAATSATNAATSATTATTQATTASNAASTATTQATAASTSATNAATSATTATNQATIATTQATNASTSATNAATSATTATTQATTATTQATNAATSASGASTSATNAAASAATATTQATNSANSATAASSSAVSAASSAASAAALLDNFDDRYLGPKTTDPALDNDGNALLIGALYFNTTAGVMKVYTASGWLAASSASVATLATFEFVATSGQTVFTGNDANGVSLSYVAPALLVTLNGVRLRPGDDYTATNGTSITLVSAAALNDELVVDAFGSFLVANTYTIAQADALLANKLATSAGAVGATNLASDGVTTVKIANDAVTTTKIANYAVTAAKVESGALLGPFFYGRNTSTQSGNGGRLKYAMNNGVIDTHSGFNSGSNRWTVPSGQSGNYVIDVSVYFRMQTGGSVNQVISFIYVNNLEITYAEIDLDAGTSAFYGMVVSHSRALSLSAGDYVEVFFQCNSGFAADARSSGVQIQRIR